MNEELQKELLSILRAMKDGAPHDWQTLVDQRSTYCLTIGGFCVAVVLASLALGIFGRSILLRGIAKNNEDAVISGIVCLAVSVIAGSVAFFKAMGMVAEGLAPLGRVLEALR